MRTVLEWITVLACLGVGLFCLALAVLGWLDGGEMTIEVFPVPAEGAVTAMAVSGVFGVLSSVLAMGRRRWQRVPLLLWSLGLVAVLAHALVRTSYRFDGIGEFGTHALWVIGAMILFIISVMRFRSSQRGTVVRPYRTVRSSQ